MNGKRTEARGSALILACLACLARNLRRGIWYLTHAAATLQDGTHDLSWGTIKRGVQTYVAERAIAAAGPYTQCYIGKASSCTDTGLVSGIEYWYRVKALGAAGPSVWSDRASKRAT